jgi:hypothetical protein
LSAYSTTSGLDFLVDLLRHRISDPKLIFSVEVKEDAGTADGLLPATFLTDNLPIATGFDTHLRVGRNYYGSYTTPAAAVTAGNGYVFSLETGSFKIPAGATAPASGDRAQVSYVWKEEQEFKFTDQELQFYLGDAISEINSAYYNFGHSFVTTGGVAALSVSPAPQASEFASYAYAQYAAILVKQQLESEGFDDRIFVRDINITIDTSKGLGDLGKSTKRLRDDFAKLMNTFLIDGQESAFQRIDTYSTYPLTGTYTYKTNSRMETEFFGE